MTRTENFKKNKSSTWFYITDCKESGLDVTGELRVDGRGNVLAADFLVVLENLAQVRERPRAQDGVELGLVCSPLSCPGVKQFLFH